MFASQMDSFASSQSTQAPDSGGVSKSRGGDPGVIPLTVKQISEAYESAGDKSSFVVDGVDATNVKLLGLVVNKAERATDISFTLDDGTGRIDVMRWVNDGSDANETALIQNGMYVTVIGSFKGFQEQRRVVAFSIRPVVDYNAITLHFIQCINVHLKNARDEDDEVPETPMNSLSGGTLLNEIEESLTSISNQSFQRGSMRVRKPAAHKCQPAVHKLVLSIFQEPASLESDHGLHVDQVAKRLGLPITKIKEAIDYHVAMGHIYSTIDDDHFKSAFIN